MSKKRRENQEPTPAAPNRRNSGPGLPWHPAWRWLVSLLIVIHLLALFVAPWDLSTEPALPPGYVPPVDAAGRPLPPPAMDSPLWQQPVLTRKLRRLFRHYLNLAYLNHGYQFFAPDPGGSHLIRYQVWNAEGAEIASGKFPDLQTEWPRLFYHRYMMLAAQTGDMGEESGRLYARHLLRTYGGKRARLEWVLHKLLSPRQVLDGTPLDDKSTYVVLAEIRETAELPAGSPAGEPAVAIPGGGR